MKKKRITILIPMYNEEGNIEKLYSELENEIKKIKDYSFRYLFVVDGCEDNTAQIVQDLAKKDPKLEFIVLSKNFGKEAALTAGIQNVDSDAVIIMDADLQHPPKYISKFINHWKEGYEIVATKRTSIEKRSFVKKLGSKIFYYLFNMASDVKMVPQTTDFGLLDKSVVDVLKRFTERNRMVRGLVDWIGFKKIYVNFEAPQRYSGEATYTYKKLLSLAINSMTSFSLLPLKIAGYLGLFILSASGLILVAMIIDKLFFNLGKFASLSFFIVFNTLLIGVIISCLGIIALYIGNINTEAINRPIYIIRRRNNGKDHYER